MPKFLHRKLLVFAALLLTVPWAQTAPLLAQQTTTPAAGTPPQVSASSNRSNWAVVQALKPGQAIEVRQIGLKTKCQIVSSDADSLTCANDTAKSVIVQREKVQSIRVAHRGRSTLVGVIPGVIMTAAGGIGLATENCSAQLLCGVSYGALVLLGAALTVVGLLVGYFTDFTGGMIYRKA